MRIPASIGHITLNISLFFYVIYFFPQLWRNYKNVSKSSISYGLHGLYCLAAAADWIYGAGFQMNWQYRMVTAIFALALLIQHLQIRPRCTQSNKQSSYRQLTIAMLILTLVALGLSDIGTALPQSVLTSLGYLSSLCWFAAFIPQIIANHQTKNGKALSHLFILITIITAGLDWVSAVALHWATPSLIAPPCLALLHTLCWWQQSHYRKKALIHSTIKQPPIACN